MKITDVRLYRITAPRPATGSRTFETHAVPADLYPDLREAHRGRLPENSLSAHYVEILSDEPEITGLFGPIQPSQVDVIRRDLKPFLLGRDPLAGELLLDQMLRLDRHGRSGLFMTGVSPVDCAL